MAKFRLPKNSKIAKGKTIDVSAGTKNAKTFKVYRWDPDSGETVSYTHLTLPTNREV